MPTNFRQNLLGSTALTREGEDFADIFLYLYAVLYRAHKVGK